MFLSRYVLYDTKLTYITNMMLLFIIIDCIFSIFMFFKVLNVQYFFDDTSDSRNLEELLKTEHIW